MQNFELLNKAYKDYIEQYLEEVFERFGDQQLPKHDPLVVAIREQVAEMYAQGRNTVMGDQELEIMVRNYDVERYERLIFHKSH